MSEEGRKQFDEEIKDKISFYGHANKRLKDASNSKEFSEKKRERIGMEAYVASRKIEVLQERLKELEKG